MCSYSVAWRQAASLLLVVFALLVCFVSSVHGDAVATSSAATVNGVSYLGAQVNGSGSMLASSTFMMEPQLSSTGNSYAGAYVGPTNALAQTQLSSFTVRDKAGVIVLTGRSAYSDAFTGLTPDGASTRSIYGYNLQEITFNGILLELSGNNNQQFFAANGSLTVRETTVNDAFASITALHLTLNDGSDIRIASTFTTFVIPEPGSLDLMVFLLLCLLVPMAFRRRSLALQRG